MLSVQIASGAKGAPGVDRAQQQFERHTHDERGSELIPIELTTVSDHVNRTRCDHVKLTRGCWGF
jgi:hypothetical protein